MCTKTKNAIETIPIYCKPCLCCGRCRQMTEHQRKEIFGGYYNEEWKFKKY